MQKRKRRESCPACISMVLDSALSRVEQGSDQRVGWLESPATQPQWKYVLYRF